MAKHQFRLYLSGNTDENEALVKNVQQSLESLESLFGKDGFDFNQLSILEHGEQAQFDGIFCTPTLLQTKPKKEKFIGIASIKNLKEALKTSSSS